MVVNGGKLLLTVVSDDELMVECWSILGKRCGCDFGRPQRPHAVKHEHMLCLALVLILQNKTPFKQKKCYNFLALAF